MTAASLIITPNELRRNLSDLGLKKGMNIMVHSSMKNLGWVVNGPVGVINSIRSCIGEEGTLMVPTHTGQLTDPSDWNDPSIPPEDIDKVRDHMYPFDKKLTIPRNRGSVSHAILFYPNVYRSSHPLSSVAALGKNAQIFTSTHPLNESEGENSPIGKLYAASGKVLLLGTTLTSCTAIHLAEFIAGAAYLKDNTIKVLVHQKGKKQFVQLKQYPGTSKYFDKFIPEFKRHGFLQGKTIGHCRSFLVDVKPAIDLVVDRIRSDPLYAVKP